MKKKTPLLVKLSKVLNTFNIRQKVSKNNSYAQQFLYETLSNKYTFEV